MLVLPRSTPDVRVLRPILLCLIAAACAPERPWPGDADLVSRHVLHEGNVTYSFPQATDEALRTALVGKCQRSIRENLELLGETAFTDTFDLEFRASRKEMIKYGGIAASGLAYPERGVMFCIVEKDYERNSPIQHELMHMITMLKWGRPPNSSIWMNEGLATWSTGTDTLCAGRSYEQIYTYMLQSDKRIPLEDLAADFYGHPEMIAYTQCAFLSGSLLSEHGAEKFTRLWKSGFEYFEEVYGMPYQQWQDALDLRVRTKYPNKVALDWERLLHGC